MIATVSPSLIHGEVCAPASKSAMQRACALALMNKGTTKIYNPGKSNDDLAAQDIIKKCGAMLYHESDYLRIVSDGKIRINQVIHCGESGLSVRMFTPILALSASTITITGEGSLKSRPMNVFEDVLPQLGVSIRTESGFLPMEIKGPVKPGNCKVDGSKSSQYITGILFALARSAKERLTLTVTELTSRPYVDLSLQMLAHFGYKIENDRYTDFVIHPIREETKDIVYINEGDWSGAAFLLVAAATAGRGVLIKGLDKESTQADRAIVDVLRACGSSITFVEDDIRMEANTDLMSFKFDATHCPDLFPPLVALAVNCAGETVINGTSRLITKESNRLDALIKVFTEMGASIRAEKDSMIIQGKKQIHGANVDGHHDHRIVMACAIAALSAEGKMKISGAEAIDKSYPDFFEHLQRLGADISLT